MHFKLIPALISLQEEALAFDAYEQYPPSSHCSTPSTILNVRP